MGSAIKKILNLNPQGRETVHLSCSKEGALFAALNWAGGPDKLTLILTKTNQPEPVAQVEGPSPLLLTYNLSAPEVAKDTKWSLTVVNYSSFQIDGVEMTLDIPGVVVAEVLPDKIGKAKEAFSERLASLNRGASRSAVNIENRKAEVVVPVFSWAKAVMMKANIKELPKAGDVPITRNVNLKPGLYQPRNPALHGNPTQDELNFMGSVAQKVRYSAPTGGAGVNQDEAVMMGRKIDLGNITLYLKDNIRQFIIVAEELTCGPNAKITWVKPANLAPPVSYSTPQREHKQGFQTFDPKRQTAASKFHSPDGDSGGAGANGRNGANGLPAPNIKLIVEKFIGFPQIDVTGAPGYPGENGQIGEDGGHGAKGLGADCGVFDCSRGAGYGGNGGDGGKGGNGANGGRGGQGGEIFVLSPADSLASLMSSGIAPIYFGGIGADAGKGGNGGNRGLGGDSGDGDGLWCDDEPSRRGKDGKSGQRGQDGIGYSNAQKAENFGPCGKMRSMIVSPDDFENYFAEPYLQRMDPPKGGPGCSVKLYGLNLVKEDVVYFNKKAAPNAHYIGGDDFTFNVPSDLVGGFYEVAVKRFNTKWTNVLSFEVTPVITGISKNTAYPGEAITITGKAFMPGALVVFGGKSIVPTTTTTTQINFTIPYSTNDLMWIREAGGKIKIAVYNQQPSDERSNELDFTVLPVYGLHFDMKKDAWKFENPSDAGVPDWDTLCRTFGEDEVTLSSIFNPLLFWPFFGFYEVFGKGPFGLCTGMATTSLNRFRSGVHNTGTLELNAARRDLTIAFGHMLGIDQLKSFNDQVEKGLDNVRESFNRIEQFFKSGSDLQQTPVLFFLPSGTVWDYDRFKRSHAVAPFKITYAQAAGTFPAYVHIYDSNHPEAEQKVEFFESGGKLHFKYEAGNYDTSHGYTVGVTSLSFMLLQDPDMPISLLEGGLLLLDTAMSPVNVQISNAGGETIGYKDGKVHLGMKNAMFVPFAPNTYVLPFGGEYTRKIQGTQNGKYSYSITSSEGLSVLLQDVPTAPGAVDEVRMSDDSGVLEFRSGGVEKSFNLVFAFKEFGNSKVIKVTQLKAKPGMPLRIWINDDLNEFGIMGTATEQVFKVEYHFHNKSINGGKPITIANTVTLPADTKFKSTVTQWAKLADANARVQEVSKEMVLPDKVIKWVK